MFEEKISLSSSLSFMLPLTRLFVSSTTHHSSGSSIDRVKPQPGIWTEQEMCSRRQFDTRFGDELPRGQSSVGTVCWGGEGAGSAGGVALRCPTDGVARRPLEEKKNNVVTRLWDRTQDRLRLVS